MKHEAEFVVCVENKSYPASLDLHKIYRLIPDRAGAKHGLIRIIDETGKDYLFPKEDFVPSRSFGKGMA